MAPDALAPPPSFALDIPISGAIGGAPLYLTNEDALLLTVFNGAAGVTVTISGRTLAFGAKHPTTFKRTLTPPTNRTSSTLNINLGDGWLLGCQVIVTAGTPLDGQTWARVSLVRGLTSVADEHFTLVSDTVTVGKSIAWPNGIARGALEGPGALRSITGTNPGAGNEISETVPTGARWQVLSFRYQLVTSAVVANRQSAIAVDDGVNSLFYVGGTTVQPASGTFLYSYAQGLAPLSGFATNAIGYGFPTPNFLPAGARIRTQTVAKDAGDVYSVVQYLVREWLEA